MQNAEGKAREEEKESEEMSPNTSKNQKSKAEKKRAQSKDEEEFRPTTGSVWLYIIEYKMGRVILIGIIRLLIFWIMSIWWQAG